MRGMASVCALALALAILGEITRPLLASDAPMLRSEKPAPPSPAIVIGFVGGFVGHDNQHHGPVQLAKQIRPELTEDSYVRIFENRRRRNAYHVIVKLLDTNRDGILSTEEKAHARIVLFGQSWGASAAVLLARDRKSTRLNSSHQIISYAVFCLKKKNLSADGNVNDQHCG